MVSRFVAGCIPSVVHIGKLKKSFNHLCRILEYIHSYHLNQEVQLELLLENSLWLGAVGLAACCVYSIGSNNVSICILVN